MSRSRVFRLGMGILGTTIFALPALADSPDDDPPPPYSSALTQAPDDDRPPPPHETQATDVPVQVTPPPATVVVQTPTPTSTSTSTPTSTIAAPTPIVVEERPVSVTVVEPRREIGMAVSLGGGVGQFTDATLRDHTGVNGEYEARVLLGTRSPIAVEAAYVGTAGSIDALGLDDNAILISSGIEGLARLNLGNSIVQPFIVGGASWVRYSIVNASVNTSDVRDRDDVFAIPVGAGLATYVGDTGFMADVRFMYRFTFSDDLMKPQNPQNPQMTTTPTSDGSSLANWNVSLRVGYAF